MSAGIPRLWDDSERKMEPSERRPISIMIATPAGGSAVDVEYLKSVFVLQREFLKKRPEVRIELATISISDLPVARNLLAHGFMRRENFTHLLFVDADMGFNPSLVEKMINFDKPFVGVAYPARSLGLDGFRRTSQVEQDNKMAAALAQNYVCAEAVIPSEYAEDGTPKYRLHAGGFVKAREVGTGILLLRRSVFSQIAEHFPDIMLTKSDTYIRMGADGTVGQFFSSVRDEDGEWLAEDLSFCRRWTASGGDIWMCVGEDSRHVGRLVHSGAYLERMRRGMFQASE